MLNVAGGTVGGGVGAAIAPGLTNIGAKIIQAARRGFRGAVPSVSTRVATQLEQAAQRAGVNLGQVSDDVLKQMHDDAIQAMRMGRWSDEAADAMVRRSQAGHFGFAGGTGLTRGQASQDPLQYATEVDLAKIEAGRPLMERHAAQRAQGARIVSDVFGDPSERAGAQTPLTAGQSVQEAVQKRAADWQDAVSAKYQAAEEAMPDLTIAGDRLQAIYDPVRKRHTIPGPVRAEFRNLMKQEGGFDPLDLERLDQLLSEHYGHSPPTDRAIRQLSEGVRGLLDEFGEEAGGLYREAVAEAAKRFQAIGPHNRIVGRLVRGDIGADESVQKVLRSGLVDDVQRIRGFIEESSPQAWRDAKASLLNDMVDRVTDNRTANQFNANQYRAWIKSMGKDKLRAIFDPEVADEMLAFDRVVKNVFQGPQGSPINRANTAVRGWEMMSGWMRKFGASQLAQKLDDMARARSESAAVMHAVRPDVELPELPPENRLMRYSRGAGAAGMAPGAEVTNRLLESQPR